MQPADPTTAEFYRRLFEDAPVAEVLISPDGRIAHANLAFEDLTGRPGAALRNLPFVDVIHPDDRAATTGPFDSLVRGGASAIDVELRYLRTDGEVRWASISMHALRDADDGAMRIISARLRDVTERRNAAATLALGSDRRAALRTLHDVIADAALDRARVSEGVARLVAAECGDLCLVAVTDPDGRLVVHPEGIAHRRPDAVAHLRLAAVEAPLAVTSPTAARSLAACEILAFDDAASAIAEFDTEALRETLNRLGITSLAFVPLEARGEVHGMLLVGRNRTSAPFGDEDRLHFVDIAERVSLALADADLHARTMPPGAAVELDSSMQAALTESEARYRRITENAPDVIYRLAVRPDLHYEYVSPSVERICGFSPEDHLEPVFFTRIIHPEDLAEFERLRTHPPDRGATLALRWRHRDGRVLHTQHRLTPLYDADGQYVGVEGIARDVTDVIEAEAARRRSENRYRTIVETAAEGIWLVDADGVGTFVNERLGQMLGYSVADMVGRSVYDFVADADRQIATRHFARRRKGATEQVEFRFTRRDGTLIWTQLATGPLFDTDDTYRGAVAMVMDITTRKETEAELAYRAQHDDLTDLPNRQTFFDRLSVAIERSGRTGGNVTVLFVDLDRFKVVNDGLGHEAGDHLLESVAMRLQSLLRQGDTLARFGGDEFVILADNMSHLDGAVAYARRIVEAFQEPFLVGDNEVFSSTSVGIALATPGDGPQDVLRHADAAVFHAKANGRNRFEVFDNAMRTELEDRLDLERSLHHALERNELHVVYQPVVDAQTTAPIGCEALLRWNRGPDKPRVGPDKFIGIAEDTGLIVPIGAFVLEEAARQATIWNRGRTAGPPLRMHVNLSARQLSHPDLFDVIHDALRRTGCEPSWIELEVTESVLVDDPADRLGRLQAIRDLGVRIAIDDFGTGYSSLAYLKQFPLDMLKIDKTFVDGLGSDPNDTAIVTATVDLAHALDLLVLAEGVETEAQLAALRALKCDLLQGYKFATPLSPDDFEEWLRAADAHAAGFGTGS